MSVEEKDPRREAAQARKRSVGQLFQGLILATGMSSQSAAQMLGLSYDKLYSRYLKLDHLLHTDPDDTVNLARFLAARLPGHGAAALPELLRLLDLLQLPLSRYAEVRALFPQQAWAAAWAAFANQALTLEPTRSAQAPVRPSLFQLRAPTRDFVGRSEELERLVGWMRQTEGGAPIAVIAGLAGAGKTELTLKTAQRLLSAYPDGQLWVSLHGSSEAPLGAEQALTALIGAFNPGLTMEGDTAGRLDRLKALYCAHLAGRKMLVIADDAGSASQVEPLMPPVGCGLLVTSRPRLALPGALSVNLGALSPAESARLYEAICPRAGLVSARLAELCGHLPLAIRVSAGDLRSDATVSPARYYERLACEAERLRLLRGQAGGSQDVAAALALSYAALSPDEQALFAQMGVFGSSFDLAAALAVLEPSEQVEGHLSNFYLRSLLEYDEQRERYWLHDLVRVFALEQLAERGAVEQRHGLHYLSVAQQTERLYLVGGEEARGALARFDGERRHIEAAWAWARRSNSALALDLALATIHVGELRLDHGSERIPWLEEALDIAGRLRDRRSQGLLQGALGRSWLALGDAERAEACLREQERYAAEEDDGGQAAVAAVTLGLVAFALSDFPRAREQFARGEALARASGDRRCEGEALSGLAQVQHIAGELDVALKSFRRRLTLAGELRDLRGESMALGGQGNVLLDLGRYDEAQQCYQLQLGIARELGDRREEADSAGGLGQLSLEAGKLDEAHGQFQSQLIIARELGNRREEADALGGLGQVALRRGATSDALIAFEEQLALNRQTGNLREEGYALGGIGAVYQALGDLTAAQGYYKRWHEMSEQVGHRKGASLAAWRLGLVLVKLGATTEGLELMAELVRFTSQVGHPDAPRIAGELKRLGEEQQSLSKAAPEAAR